MTVNTLVNGELRVIDLPAPVREDMKYACRKDGPCTLLKSCDQCDAWNPLRLMDARAERDRLEARAVERAYSTALRRERINLRRDELELWGRDKWAWMARRKADSVARAADGRS